VIGNFWGQYFATDVDPSDPRRFWTFQQYVEAEDTYAVRITELIRTEAKLAKPSTTLRKARLLRAGTQRRTAMGSSSEPRP